MKALPCNRRSSDRPLLTSASLFLCFVQAQQPLAPSSAGSPLISQTKKKRKGGI